MTMPHGTTDGFTILETLIAVTILLTAMGVALVFFVDFGEAVNSESTTLATQQSGRAVLDEVVRNLREIGFGTLRNDPFNPASWQSALVYGGSHVIAFNGNSVMTIGGLGPKESISFPTGDPYFGEGIAKAFSGAETIIYTIDADGNNTIDANDRVNAAAGSYNPASETTNPLDFALFRRVYGWNGTDYGGELEPMAPYVFTNATSDSRYPVDNTTPAPLFTYWLTEDLNSDGLLAPEECVDTVAGCPPAKPRDPRLYLWGDSNFDGTLSEAEKLALLDMEVGSTTWSGNIFVENGAYKSTTTTAEIDPAEPGAFEVQVGDASRIGPGYHVQIGTDGGAETFLVDQVVTASTPNKILLSTEPLKVHGVGATVQVLPSTVMRAIRSVGFHYTTIADKKDSVDGVALAGRSGGQGTGGLDYRVTAFQRRIEVVNAPSSAMAASTTDGDSICPVFVRNMCSGGMIENSAVFAAPGGKTYSFLVTGHDGTPLKGIAVTFSNANPSVGSLVEKNESKSDENGVAEVGYVPLGDAGADTITASVTCLVEGGALWDDSASNHVAVYGVKTTYSADCLSTVSDRTPSPTAGFSMQIISTSGPIAAQPVEFELKIKKPVALLNPVVAQLFVDETLAGTTNEVGELAGVTAETSAEGRVRGSVTLSADGTGKGAIVELTTRFLDTAGCGSTSASFEKTFGFFDLDLDSTIPGPGCTELFPCIIPGGSLAPKVAADLSIAGYPVSDAPLEFSATDKWVPPGQGNNDSGDGWVPPGQEEKLQPKSILTPESGVRTNDSGRGFVSVSNNESKLIRPQSRLKTIVDVTSSGPDWMCSAGSISNTGSRVAFEFEGPVSVCQADLAQAWVQRTQDDELCMDVLNGGEHVDCALQIRGVEIKIYDVDGVTPDRSNGTTVNTIEGGSVGTAAECSENGSVKLFQDQCREPNTALANGETWMFENSDACQSPSSSVLSQYFFSMNKIQFDDDVPGGRAMDVTIFFNDSDGEVQSRTFQLTTPF